MPTAKKTIAITRPSADKDALTGLLQRRGYSVVREPLTHISLRRGMRDDLARAVSSNPDAVIVTSKHGVQALATLSLWRDPVLICVGAATERTAQALGFHRTFNAGGTAQQIIEHIAYAYDEGARFLYVSAEHTRMDLAKALTRQGMLVERLVLYEAAAAKHFSDIFAARIEQNKLHAVTFLSQRAAQVFMALAEEFKLTNCLGDVHACALSKAVAKPLKKSLWKSVRVAREPTLMALADCVDATVATRKKKS